MPGARARHCFRDNGEVFWNSPDDFPISLDILFIGIVIVNALSSTSYIKERDRTIYVNIGKIKECNISAIKDLIVTEMVNHMKNSIVEEVA